MKVQEEMKKQELEREKKLKSAELEEIQ